MAQDLIAVSPNFIRDDFFNGNGVKRIRNRFTLTIEVLKLFFKEFFDSCY